MYANKLRNIVRHSYYCKGIEFKNNTKFLCNYFYSQLFLVFLIIFLRDFVSLHVISSSKAFF